MGLTMTIKERLEVHRQIERENKRKEREWLTRLNVEIAAEELRKLIAEGIVS